MKRSKPLLAFALLGGLVSAAQANIQKAADQVFPLAQLFMVTAMVAQDWRFVSLTALRSAK